MITHNRRDEVVASLDRLTRLPRGTVCLTYDVGPVNWDIVAEDWACWRQGISAEECARRYLAETERIGGGIILMHDSSEEEFVRRRNQTMQMTKILVPALKERGYRFVRLDAAPRVREAIAASVADMSKCR